MIAHDGRNISLPDQGECLFGFRTVTDRITQANHGVYPAPFNIKQDFPERFQVTVNIGNNRKSHGVVLSSRFQVSVFSNDHLRP